MRHLSSITPSTAFTLTRTTPTLGARFMCLTQADMAERRMQGLCFNCPEKFSREHMRQCTMKGIYLMEIDDEATTDDDISDIDVEISLHAFTGIKTGYTMHWPPLSPPHH